MYLRRARNFGRAMDAALEARNADAVGLSAVHAVISACDALTIRHLGMRSAAQDHSEVLKLLPQSGAPDRLITQVRLVLSLKNRVEYEAREVSPDEATRIATAARRVLDYVGSQIEI